MFAMMLIGLSLQAVSTNQAPSHRCWADETHNGIKVRVYKGDRICVDLAPATEMEGVWVNDFEGSAFYEGARSIADVRGGKARFGSRSTRRPFCPALSQSIMASPIWSRSWAGRREI